MPLDQMELGLFPPAQATLPIAEPRMATEKQIAYATALARRLSIEIPRTTLRDRDTLSRWIDAHKTRQSSSKYASYPSAKQVAFAERIARAKRREVPRECFRDKTLMSRWIDGNKPR